LFRLSAAEELELEPQHPTQQVRDILDCVAPEQVCRAYLRAWVDHVRARLTEKES
jgi:hypothetical protein